MNEILKAILLTLVICIVAFVLTLKISGASDLPINVEREGYCKIQYGENWYYNEQKGYCSDGKEIGIFTEQEFREICPKVRFLDSRFYSDCFHEGKRFP